MDVDVSELGAEGSARTAEAAEEAVGPRSRVVVPQSVAGSEKRDAEEVARRMARAAKRGAKLRAVLGDGGKYVVDLGEYRRKKVRVFVQYEGYSPSAIEESRRLRVAVTIPAKWADAPAAKLKATFLETYAARGKGRIEPGDALLAVTDSRSYLTFAKTMIKDSAKVGDAFHENEEIFVVTSADVQALDAQVRTIETALADYERQATIHRTIDPSAVVEMSTVSGQIDPCLPHVLLLGMNKAYLLPVQPSFTVADIKAFIHFKGGPDNFPLASLDVAVLRGGHEIFVLADDDTIEALAKRLYGDDATLLNPDDHKPVVPLLWGKRLQDPKYFLWIPSLHTPDSFKGPNDAANAPTGQDPAALAAANAPRTAGGDCLIS